MSNEKAAWIPASEPPKERGKYLIWGEYSFTPDHNDEPNRLQHYGVATWHPAFEWWCGEGRLERVLYWQPLPPRPDDAAVVPYRVEVDCPVCWLEMP